MKIKLDQIDTENFLVRPNEIAGEICWLVQPNHIGCQWSKDNLHFRSSMWNSQGELISASWKKFFNYTEKPNLVPDPTDMQDMSLIEKIDGSTLIISKYKGHLINRTRGTFDAHFLDNGDEIDELIKRYPKAFDNNYINKEDMTFIFEWVTPRNRIVIDYPELDIYLIGAIYHDDYSYMMQSELDQFAKYIEVKRPRRFKFNTVPEMISAVQEFKGMEGICAYFNKEQDIKKLKGVEYLSLHRFKSNCNVESVLDMFLSYDMPDYQDFIGKVESHFDFESCKMAMPFISSTLDAWKTVKKIEIGMKEFVNKISSLSSRKEQAVMITKSYGRTSRSGYVFTLLDGKPFNKEMYKKLMWQVLKEGGKTGS
jgi:hypothetical protein